MHIRTSSKSITGSLITAIIMVIIFAGVFIALSGEMAELLIVFGIFALCAITSKRLSLLQKLAETLRNNISIAVVFSVIFAIILPLLLNNSYVIHTTVLAIIIAIAALGLNFQIGCTGMVNVAIAAFMGMGAYTSAVISVYYGLSPWLGIISGMITATLLAIIIGSPTLKTHGYYVALVTIALQFIFSRLVNSTKWLGGPNGIAGIPDIAIGALTFGQYQKRFYLWLALLCLGVCIYIAYRLRNSRIGLAWNAIEQDQIVAVTQGINVAKMKLLAFAIGGAYAGLAGSLYAHFITFVSVDDFSMPKSLMLICMVALGGMDNVLGVVVGAVFLTVLNEKILDFADYGMFLYGVILLIVLLSRPQGLLPKTLRRYRMPKENAISDLREKSEV